MSKKERTAFWKNSSFYFLLVYTILNIACIAQMLMVDVLPIKYSIPIVVVLLFVWLGLFCLVRGKRVSKINRILGKALIVILSILLVFANSFIFKTSSVFQKITGDSKKVSVVSVIVMKEHKAEAISDLKDATFGLITTGDKSTLTQAVISIEKDLNKTVSISEIKDYKTYADSLYNGEVDAILVDAGTMGMFEETHPKFPSETKVIKEYKFETKTNDISKNVKVTENAFNVYITGIDTYGTVSTVSHSDVNMIVTINPKTKTVLMTSIPRDYYIPQTCQNNQVDKLTHSGLFGVECTITSVENYFNKIDINYYARVNFSSVVEIVDAIGGIVVDNPTTFTAFDGTTFQAGAVPLSGDKALTYSRERKVFADGDRERGRNQMRVFTGIINKITSPTIITQYAGIMDAIGNSFQTNMSESEMSSLVKMQINDMSSWKIEQISVNGVGNESAWSPALGNYAWVMEPTKKTVDNAVDLIRKVEKGEDISGLVKDVNAQAEAAG